MTPLEPTLAAAHASWANFFSEGLARLHANDPQAALPLLSAAVTQSARFHPLYHFLESGLHTELAQLHLHAQAFDAAETHYARALFLHHDNRIAAEGCAAARAAQSVTFAAYETDALTAPLFVEPSEETIFSLRASARSASTLEESCTRYSTAITLCDSTHQHYHRLAALPWIERARCFVALQEFSLAQNDLRRAYDLDRTHPDIAALREPQF